jgi:tRNA-dihydrouridine synthase A
MSNSPPSSPHTSPKRLKSCNEANSSDKLAGINGAHGTDACGRGLTSGTEHQCPPQMLSVAPMMDYTDVHYRQLARLMSKNTWLYTEMVVDSTLIFNPDHDRFLAFPEEQHPISCQLGGSNPENLAKAAKIVADYGYDEINLNCGCPSDRVAGAGCFGAAMMLQPDLVAACCSAMAAAVPHIPITVKCRIGVDDKDSYDLMHEFIRVVSTGSPVTHFIIHARKCLLKGLSPHQNRTIPPLRYEWLLALKRDFPHLEFSLNGGILTLKEALASLDFQENAIHGVMIGRAAYGQPWHVLAGADVDLFGEATNPAKNRKELLYEYAAYADGQIGKQCIKPDGHKVPSLRTLTKPILGIFSNEPRGKKWRAAIDKELRTSATLTEILDKTLGILPEDVLLRGPVSIDRKTLDCTGVVPGLAATPLPEVTLRPSMVES